MVLCNLVVIAGTRYTEVFLCCLASVKSVSVYWPQSGVPTCLTRLAEWLLSTVIQTV